MRLSVDELGQLVDLVKADPTVSPLALHLASKQVHGITTIAATAMAGAILMIGSVTFLAHHDCSSFTGSCSYSTSWPFLGLGAGTMAVGGVIGSWMLPRRGELRDVAERWNDRHPDQPLTVDGAK
jgi:hypothetical protein